MNGWLLHSSCGRSCQHSYQRQFVIGTRINTLWNGISTNQFVFEKVFAVVMQPWVPDLGEMLVVKHVSGEGNNAVLLRVGIAEIYNIRVNLLQTRRNENA